MRIRRLVLDQYGTFAHAELNFATEPGRLTLVTAPNGAGKSVLRHAFHDLLFDIPKQSAMSFRHGYRKMALMADAIGTDGAAFSFGWSRDDKPPRVTNDPARFEALRRETTPEQLEKLFALDTARLRAGGTDLKKGQTLAEALLSGTGELASAHRVRAELEARRQANWGPRKSTPPLNAAMAELERSRKAAAEAIQRPAARQKQDQDLAAARAALQTAQAASDAALLAIGRLNRIEHTRPHLDALRMAEAWFAANPDAPALPPGLDVALSDARGRSATASARLLAAREALRTARAQEAAIEADPAVAQHAAALAALPGRLGEVEKARKDSADRRTERAAALDLVARALRDIGADVPVEQARRLVPPVAALTAARAAIVAHEGLRTALALALAGVNAAALERAEAEHAEVSAPPVPEGLADLLQTIRADRNPAQHATELDAQCRQAGTRVTAALATAPGWTGTAPALRTLRPAADDAYRRADQACREAEALAQTRFGARDQAFAALEADRRALNALQDRPLPDDAAIAAARAARDRGWALIHRRAFGGDPDAAGEAAYAEGGTLPQAFERHLRAADTLADQRVIELERVQHAAQLTQRIADAAGPCEAASTHATEAEAALDAARAAWTALTAPLGLGATPGLLDVQRLLTARTEVIAALATQEDAEDARDAVAAAHAAWAGRLATLLERPAEPLPALLALADTRLRAANAAATAATLRRAKQESARFAATKAAAALTTAEERLSAWRAGWATILITLNRPADETPDATAAVLERLLQLDQADNAASDLGRRIDAMDADNTAFDIEIQRLAAALGEPADPRALLARRDRADAQTSKRQQAHLTAEDRARVHDDAAEQAAIADRALMAVIAQAGATDGDGADRRIAAAREHARHATLRDDALRSLLTHGGGLSREALQTEADAVLPDMLPIEQDRARQEAANAGQRREDAAVLEDQLRTRHEADGAATTATDAAADHAAAAALYARLLDEQLVLQVASGMLGRAMDAVQDQAGESGLTRLSQAFQAVTAGAYTIEAGEDTGAGVPFFAVERRFPGERKAPEELSEGTRDQLYLALRIKALRESPTRLPFIADDILQTFDDERAAAALGALLDLSAHNQVIVLTHHGHVAALAQAFGDRIHQESLP